MDCRADQPIDHADIVNDEFAPTVVAVSRLVRGLDQMFLDKYAFFIREKQAFSDLNVQHGPSNSVLPRGSSRSAVHETPRTPAPLSTTGCTPRVLSNRRTDRTRVTIALADLPGIGSGPPDIDDKADTA
jgi:hypothetical protein